MKFRRKKKQNTIRVSAYEKKNRRKYYKDSLVLLLRKMFRSVLAYRIIGICFSLLAIFFAVSVFFSKAGEFIVSLDKNMSDIGFLISENPDFKDAKVKLFSKALDKANNISILDLPKDIDKIDGSHNGTNYIAYTYYIQNAGKKQTDYIYELDITETSLGVDQAAWVMVFQNGKQVIYAKENKDGKPECQYSYEEFPISKYAKKTDQVIQLTDKKRGYLTKSKIKENGFLRIDGLYELRTEPFKTDDIICKETREKMQPGDVDKYTVVVWLEGEDPECVDNILGGHLSMKMQFKVAE